MTQVSRTGKRSRWLLMGVPLAAAVVLVWSGLAFLDGPWFRDWLSRKLAATVMSATGLRLELHVARIDVARLRVELDRVLLHGTESTQGLPLFSARRVRAGMRIEPGFRPGLARLELERPCIHIEVRPDGATNIPRAKRRDPQGGSVLTRLVKLRIGHLDLRDGELVLNLQRVPLDLVAEDLLTTLSYRTPSSYRGQVQSRAVTFRSRYITDSTLALAAEVALEPDRILFPKLTLSRDRLQIAINGAIESLHDFRLRAHLATELGGTVLGELVQFRPLEGGSVHLNGDGLWTRQGVHFHGQLQANDLGYRSPYLRLNRVRVAAQVIAHDGGLEARALDVGTNRGSYRGKLTIDHWQQLATEGRVTDGDVQLLAPALSLTSLPWSGFADGPVRLTTSLRRLRADLVVAGDVGIRPGNGPLPIAGQASARYEGARNRVTLSGTRLELPHTSVQLGGTLGTEVQLAAESRDLRDLMPLSALFGGHRDMQFPALDSGAGTASFAGRITGPLSQPTIAGVLDLTRFAWSNRHFDDVYADGVLSAQSLRVRTLRIRQANAGLAVEGSVGLTRWSITPDSAIAVSGKADGIEIAPLLQQADRRYAGLLRGSASGTMALGGSIGAPTGIATIRLSRGAIYDQPFDQLAATVRLSRNQLRVTDGLLQLAGGRAVFAATYHYGGEEWRSGRLDASVSTQHLPLQAIAPLHHARADLSGDVTAALSMEANVRDSSLELLGLSGHGQVSRVVIAGIQAGAAAVDLETREQQILANLSGRVLLSPLTGTARVGLRGDYPSEVRLAASSLELRALAPIANGLGGRGLVSGSVSGSLYLHGSLLRPQQASGQITIEQFKLPLPSTSAGLGRREFLVQNEGPFSIEIGHGQARLQPARFQGPDTALTLSGAAPLSATEPFSLTARGSLNLALLSVIDPNVVSTGRLQLDVALTGRYADPRVAGRMELRNGSLFWQGFSNGLTQINGALRFDQSQATIERLTAASGGGTLTIAGFANYARGIPTVYRLESTVSGVRMRYAGGISVTSNAALRLAGTGASGVISGTVTLTRAAIDANADLAAIATSARNQVSAGVSDSSSPLHGVQLDVRIESAPEFQMETSLTQDLQAEVDLQLRGSVTRPTMLGRISVNEGDVRVLGNKYTINRGEITFANAARIEPTLDLDLETQARGVTVDVLVSGPASRLKINYRSDPPLQSNEIVALLAVGRTPQSTANLGGAQVTNDTSAFISGANTVLGQAFSPVSNRLQKLFGITNVKIDPLLQNLNSTPAARLTVEQQISRQVTVTYVTNLAQTAEQIFRFEFALNREYSIVAVRDENGLFGIDIQYRKRFK